MKKTGFGTNQEGEPIDISFDFWEVGPTPAGEADLDSSNPADENEGQGSTPTDENVNFFESYNVKATMDKGLRVFDSGTL